LRKYFWDYAYLISIASVIVVADQWTKNLVRTSIPLGESWSPWPWLAPYARIVHWQNTGAAFGMFQNMALVFTILAFLVTIAIVYYFPRVPRHEWAMRLAMTMQLAGAVGNLIDRLTQQGKVTDFISVGTFAVFNIADASISVGTAILVLAVWLSERKQKKLTEAEMGQPLASPGAPDSPGQMEWLPERDPRAEKKPDPSDQVENQSTPGE
jgi:signal peptidase II